MNHKLKFRAWENKGKCMLDWLCICQTAFNRVDESGRGIMYRILTNQANANDDFGYVVMPFSGLNAKDGREIYDGDCIKVSRIFGFHMEQLNEHQRIHELPDINGIGSLFEGIVVVDPRKGLMLKRYDNDYMEPIFNRLQKQNIYLDMDTCEILGNIYENPELMNQ